MFNALRSFRAAPTFCHVTNPVMASYDALPAMPYFEGNARVAAIVTDLKMVDLDQRLKYGVTALGRSGLQRDIGC